VNAAERATLAYNHHLAGRREAAEQVCRQILQRDPNNSQALHVLGRMAHDQDRLNVAEKLLRMAIAAAPDVAEFHNSLGGVLGDCKRVVEAAAAFREAVRLRPDYGQAYDNLGLLLTNAGRHVEAAEALQELSRLSPHDWEVACRRADALREAGRLTEAAAEYRRTVELHPAHARAMWGVAACSGELGLVDEAVRWGRRRVEVDPAPRSAHSDLLFAMLHAELSREQVFQEHLNWARRHGGAASWETLRSSAEAEQTPGDVGARRPLRVGYVSPSFHWHPVATFFEPLLAAHDRAAVAIFCYCDVQEMHADSMTFRLRDLCGEAAWRQTAGKSDAEVANLIRRDGIHVLVDLAGHTGGNRLPMFGQRVAPVQVSYIGYPHSTGLAAMDFKVTDEYLDPPGLTEHLYTERLVRLPGGCWSYGRNDNVPEVNELPALGATHFTFASLNRPIKLTPGTLRLWAEILRRVPNARLLAAVGQGCEHDPGLRRLIEGHGIDPGRLALVGRRSRLDYFRLMLEVDVALDTFPHAGHTTTCDALWMGVPTVTLAGRAHASRLGVGVLSAVRLESLIAPTPEGYVERAVALASDLPKLAELRAGLRERMEQSPLCDGPRVARTLEQAYRQMWAERCASEAGKPDAAGPISSKSYTL
jgi:predicted O-linked N-acetylglucosamine transferase (SPINDLY family)